MTTLTSRIHSVRWRLAEPPSGAAMARLRGSLQAADWEGVGSPSALLVVKALQIPAHPTQGGSALDEGAMRGRLKQAWAESERPSTGRLPGAAEAVRFEDEGELLAGYLLARWEGSSHWCWDLLRKKRLASDPWQAALERPFHLPGMLSYLRAWGCLELLLRATPPAMLRRAAGSLCRALELRRFSAWLAEGGDTSCSGWIGEEAPAPDAARKATEGKSRRGDVPPGLPSRPWGAWWAPESRDIHPDAELLAGLALGAWENQVCLGQPWFFGEVLRWQRWRIAAKAGEEATPTAREKTSGRTGRSNSPASPGNAETAGTGPGSGKAILGSKGDAESAPSSRVQGNTPVSHEYALMSPSGPEDSEAIPAIGAVAGETPGQGAQKKETRGATDEVRLPSGPGRSDSAEPRGGTSSRPPSPARMPPRGETAIATEWAGVFFLLPLLRKLGWPDRPLPDFPPLPPWALLEAAAACLAARAGEDLAATWDADPLRHALPEWSPGISPQESDRSEAIRLLEPALPAVLREVSRLDDPRETVRELLLKSGRVYRTACHVDVVFPLQAVSLEARRSGLDQNPGWQPWLGRIIGYHFL